MAQTAERFVIRPNTRQGGWNILDRRRNEVVAHRNDYALAVAYVEQANAEPEA